MDGPGSGGAHGDAGKAAANGTPGSGGKQRPSDAGSGSAKRRAGSYTTQHPNDPAAAAQELLEKLSLYVTQLGGSLGEGWRCDVKIVTVADNGETGTCNATYLTPAGKRLRSRGEVAKLLRLEMPAGRPAGKLAPASASASAAAAAGSGAAHGGSRGHHSHAGEAAAAAAAAGQGGGADDEGGSMSKAEAHAAAVARTKQMQADGLSLPMQLKNGVVVEALGVVDPRPTFSTPLGLMTPGFRAVFKDPAAGSFVSEIKAPPGAKHPQFVVSLAAGPQVLAGLSEHHSSAAAGRTSVPGLSEQRQGQADAAGRGAAAAASAAEATQFELASARNADMAWAQVVGLQERARMQVDAAAAAADTLGSGGSGGSAPLGSLDGAAAAAAGGAAAQGGSSPHGDAALDPLLAQLLSKANSLKGCWGKAMFGLADADVLALLEALPGADATPNYQFVDERGGWEKEREFLAKGRWAKRSMLQAGMKKPASKKQHGQQQSGTPEAAAAKAALTAAAPGSNGAAAAGAARAGAAAGSRKRPHSAAGGGSGGAAGSDSALFAPDVASKRYKGMGKEDREVAGAVDHVLDKMIRRVEVWWGQEAAREAKKAEKAQARAAAQEAKKAAKEAAKAEGGAAAGADAATAAAAGDKQQKPAAPLPPPLQEDLQLPGATSSPSPAAAPVLSQLNGKQAHQLLQVWEFACCFGPLLELGEVPSLQQLEAGLLGCISHTGTMASSMLAQLSSAAAAGSGGDAGPGAAAQQQQESEADPEVTAAAAAAAAAAGADSEALRAAAAAAASAGQVAWGDAAGAAWVQLHISLLRLLVQEIFGAVSGATFDIAGMKAAQLRDLRTAMPHVDITTWPEAARRYLAAAATATFLAQGEPKSSATGSSAKELDLPGHLRCMEVQDWAQYLCGGLNMRDLVSRVALLPQGSSETAAECLMMLDDASALAAAEQLVQQLAKIQQQQEAGAPDVMQVDAAGAEPQAGPCAWPRPAQRGGTAGAGPLPGDGAAPAGPRC
ncbi:hypothetical protein COO60DRAFT_144260 [Scenedesmus sp. NREL 46B-D3]|nr:hypothetical protein COO60DRAFT_144260 [Scenedesmus sp. NREL 46B-D3]